MLIRCAADRRQRTLPYHHYHHQPHTAPPHPHFSCSPPSRSAQRFRRALSSSASPALASLAAGLQTSPLPPPFTWTRDASVPHAPKRTPNLTPEQTRLALRNALRYFPASTHAELAPEFARELDAYGHIYMYRFKPSAEEMAGWAAGAAHDGSDDAGAAPSPMRAYPIDAYAGTHDQTRAVQMMIMNNLGEYFFMISYD